MTERLAGVDGAVEAAPRQRSSTVLFALAAGALLLFAGFVALGTWQMQRLQWKTALIERVGQRVHAAPVPAPAFTEWPQITAGTHEYRHVRVTGNYLHALATRVQATTALGSGYWLLTPLRSTDGSIMLINRGFLPLSAPAAHAGDDKQATRAAPGQDDAETHGQVTVTGLLRISEPGGAYLRRNDAVNNRWYSRDVHAIAAARGLPWVAPYFIDADAGASAAAAAGPIGGLTVIAFHNNHLVYAVTWYALALMVAGAGLWVARDERQLRRCHAPLR